MKIIITGGGGLASAIKKVCNTLQDKKGYYYDVDMPSKDTLDVTNKRQVTNYFKKFKPDILINCAGFIKPESVKKSNVDTWLKQINVNLIGTYLCTREALKNKAKPIIINISSSSGFKGRKDWSAYCASKAGVISFTESLACEGVNAYCISPHRMDTKMRTALFKREKKDTLIDPACVADQVVNIINGFHKPGVNIEVLKDGINIK